MLLRLSLSLESLNTSCIKSVYTMSVAKGHLGHGPEKYIAGVSNTRPAMPFGNFQIINIYVKSLDKKIPRKT